MVAQLLGMKSMGKRNIREANKSWLTNERILFMFSIVNALRILEHSIISQMGLFWTLLTLCKSKRSAIRAPS